MDYLTNYYKNLSEKLQIRVNYLTFILNEAEMPFSRYDNAKNDPYLPGEYPRTEWLPDPYPGDQYEDNDGLEDWMTIPRIKKPSGPGFKRTVWDLVIDRWEGKKKKNVQ